MAHINHELFWQELVNRGVIPTRYISLLVMVLLAIVSTIDILYIEPGLLIPTFTIRFFSLVIAGGIWIMTYRTPKFLKQHYVTIVMIAFIYIGCSASVISSWRGGIGSFYFVTHIMIEIIYGSILPYPRRYMVISVLIITLSYFVPLFYFLDQPMDITFWNVTIALLFFGAVAIVVKYQVMTYQFDAYVGRINSSRFARQSEGRRIARELHDTLGQYFTGLKMELNLLQDQFPGKEDRFAYMASLLNEGVKTVRKLSQELHEDLSKASLGDMILYRLDRVKEQMKINYLFKNRFQGQVPIELKKGINRIFQEAVTNILRYARATVIEVTLTYHQKNLILTIKDDGEGFLLDQVVEGFGLESMQERAFLMKGDLKINTKLKRGTEIVLSVPVEEGR